MTHEIVREILKVPRRARSLFNAESNHSHFAVDNQAFGRIAVAGRLIADNGLPDDQVMEHLSIYHPPRNLQATDPAFANIKAVTLEE